MYQALERMLSHYGPPHDLPTATLLERAVVVVLEQQATRGAALTALDSLREAGLLDAEALAAAPREELQELIRAAGGARTKAGRLSNLARHVVNRHAGSVEALFAADAEALREELLSINGIGAATAEALVLHAAGRAAFAASIEAHRVFKRHGWVDFEADSQAIKDQAESGLDRDTALLAQLHLLLGRIGADYCGRVAHCHDCPLADLLPPDGPREAEW